MTEAATKDDATALFDEMLGLLESISAYDDRALVITIAAYLDERLLQLLKARMVRGSQTNDLLGGGNAPISTFSSRMKMAVALGCIGDREYHDLEIVRKIRNDAAHVWKEFSLSDGSQANRIKNFALIAFSTESLAEWEKVPSRERFRRKGTELLIHLNSLIYWTDRPTHSGKILWSRIASVGDWPPDELKIANQGVETSGQVADA